MASKRKMAAKRQVKVETATSMSAVANQPQWIISMQEHFHRTGGYRAADLHRLIGDPRESVGVTLSSDLEMACGISKSLVSILRA